MFILAFRLPRRRLILGALLTLLGCAALLAGAALSAGRAAQTSGEAPLTLDSNEARVAYLQSLGWAVSFEPLAQESLRVPDTFDESYDQYLALQAEQGFRLEDYAGKAVTRYTYEITNHPSGETGVQANLLLYRGTLIGGEVLSSREGGFLHGLAMPEEGA